MGNFRLQKKQCVKYIHFTPASPFCLSHPLVALGQAVQLESVNPARVRYLIVVSTLGNKQESILLGMDFPNQDRCV